MKRIFSYITICAISAAVFASCAKEPGTGDVNAEGKGRLTFDINFGGKAAQATRAAAPDDCVIRIANDRGYIYTFDGIDEIPEELWLVSGSDYSITVEGGTKSGNDWVTYGWNTPYYKGMADFDINDGQETQVEVNCTVQNTLFAVAFDSSVADKLTGYSLTLSIDGNSAAPFVFDADNLGEVANIMLEGASTIEWTFGATHIQSQDAVAKSGSRLVQPRKKYELSFKYTEQYGTLGLIEFELEEVTVINHPIIIPTVPPTALSPIMQGKDVWATHANLGCVVGTAATTSVKFAYRLFGSQQWEFVDAGGIEPGSYKKTLTGLDDDTTYETVLFVDGEMEGDPVQFTTEKAPALPNGNMEGWGTYSSVWQPYASSSDAFWGTGNTMALGIVKNETTTPSDVAGRGKVAQLKSGVVAGVFAAGNLFTGTFRLVGTTGYVNFGREFSGRPSALKVSYKANTGTVTNAGSNSPLATGAPDEFQIMIALADESSDEYDFPHEINTSNTSTFINYETHDGIIAYGAIGGSANMTDWEDATIELKYRSLTRIPTHIIIVASASKYGDYFNGSSSSIMWVDDFELVYDENIVEQE